VATDVTDAFYLNALVDAPRLAGLVPPAFELDRLASGHAVLTFLVFRNGHLGPAFLGPLRRLAPSPVQLNVRVHVRDRATGLAGVHFLTTAIEGTLIALAARLLSVHVPMHVMRRAELHREGDEWRIRLDAGAGSAVDLTATLRPIDDRRLPPPWRACFADFPAVLAYCVPQERALAWDAGRGRVAPLTVRLDARLEDGELLNGDVHCPAANAVLGDAGFLGFRIPRLTVRTAGGR
jgi:hypothetical protein